MPLNDKKGPRRSSGKGAPQGDGPRTEQFSSKKIAYPLREASSRPLVRVLAFDPGFERLGAAVVEKKNGKEVLLYSSCIHTAATLPFHERLHILGNEAVRLIKEWKPVAVAVEDVYFEKNAKTAMFVAQVRGVLVYEAARHGLPVYSYSPLQVKVATTGYGKSDKSAVAAMVSRLVTLPEKKRLDDELDAIAVGLTCLASERALSALYPQQ